MDDMKKWPITKSPLRDGWRSPANGTGIVSAHVAFGGEYVDFLLKKFGREEVRDESDALKCLEKFIAEWGATYPVRYTYDTRNRRTSLSTTRDGVTWDTTAWAYDSRTGNCISKTYADGSTVTYTYTPDNLPLRATRASGRWSENVYNERRQVVGVISSDGALDVAMTRDEFGNVTLESNPVSFVEYRLDAHGNATNEAQTVEGVSASFAREFDTYGRLKRFTRVGGGEVAIGYAADGQVAVLSNEAAVADYAFTGDRLDAGYAFALQGGADFSREVFRHGCLRGCIVAVSNHCGNASHGLEYSYDALQRPVVRNSDSFGYNARGEVSSATIGGRSESHSYDGIGNAIQAGYPETTYAYTANSRNQYSSISAIAGGTQLVASVSYDLDGNMTRHGDWTYAYNSGNRLVSVSSSSTIVATFAYDAQGRRVEKVTADGTHRYFYDGWLLVYEHITRPDNTISEVEYFWGKDVSGTRGGAAGIGGLLYVKRGGSIYVPWYDACGNILGYRDARGNVVASYTYDAFGNVITQSGALADTFSFRFSTKYIDCEICLYYYGYRYYKPLIMRWLAEDPIDVDGGINLYALCENNSVQYVDCLGLYLWYVLYYDENKSGSNFKHAAETRKKEIESSKTFNSKCDSVEIYSIRTTNDFFSVWSTLNAHSRKKSKRVTRYQVKGLYLFTHSGRGRLFLHNSTATASQIKKLPSLNWATSAEIQCLGCNSGVENDSGESLAGSFYESQNVPALGQADSSSFSSNPNEKSKWGVVLGISDVYLWAFDDEGNRIGPIKYPKK